MVLILIAFSYHNFRYFWKNITYFYFVSIVLGGVIYLWNISFPTTLFGNSYAMNFFFLLFLAPIAIAYYVRKMKSLKEQYNLYQEVSFTLFKRKIKGVGYFDSGNCLTYKRRPVILVSKKEELKGDENILIPYQTASGIGILKGIFLKEIWVEKELWRNVYLGIMEEEIALDGVDFLLHHSMMGGSDD